MEIHRVIAMKDSNYIAIYRKYPVAMPNELRQSSPYIRGVIYLTS